MKLIRLLVGGICMLAASTLFAAAAAKSTAEMLEIGVGPVGGGAESKLVRTDHGVSMTINTTGLEPAAYTVWWVIFNFPDECAGSPCGPDDVPNPDVMASIQFATGNIVPWFGDGHFAAHLSEGDTDGVINSGPGLIDARTAEVHLVVRTHGPVIPAFMPAQINSFGGACMVNACADLQAAIHTP